MRTWRLILACFCGLFMTAALMAFANPVFFEKAETLVDWYWKPGSWLDYAPNGVPDFDQKQANWGFPPPIPFPSGQWTYCGPVAAANSLWWFDSKFEPSPIPPPIKNDNYFLITPYLPWLGLNLDDHDPVNVGGMFAPANPAPPWGPAPPGLVDDLAWYFDTDGRRTMTAGRKGTQVQDMSIGLQWWLYGGNPHWGFSPAGPRYGNYYDDYHVQLVQAPSWNWVVDEVERSEDVVLLLGFYREMGPGLFERIGGHFVTVAAKDGTCSPEGRLDFQLGIKTRHFRPKHDC